MTHFGIICPAVSGHLHPMTTLGYELKQRGHRVTLVGSLDARSKALAAGLEFRAIGASAYPEGSVAAFSAQQGKLSGLAATRYTINWATESTIMLLKEAPLAIKQAGIDALLIDQFSHAGGTIAQHLDIPYISSCSCLMLNQEASVPPYTTTWQYNPAWWARLRNQSLYQLLNFFGKPIRQVVADYRRQWKLPPYSHPNQTYSQLCQVCQQPAEFEFPRQKLPKSFHFTGPFHLPASREPIPFPWEKLTGQPLIYASLGTLQNRLQGIFYDIAQACVGLDVQLVISLGGGMEEESVPTLPGNPLVVRYAPQLELLQSATLCITHAGINTVLEALSQGVPMVAIPITGDQPGVAARLAWVGAGEVIPLKRLHVPLLRRAIEQVLTDPSYRHHAIRLKEAIARSGGVKRSADIIEQVISTGKPVLASP
ncbi:glycosyltransferase [Nostoc sp. UHCC 0702]|nr:glycosyltransferase [Nostoc sp. UHCC 0702]